MIVSYHSNAAPSEWKFPSSMEIPHRFAYATIRRWTAIVIAIIVQFVDKRVVECSSVSVIRVSGQPSIRVTGS